MPDTSLGRSVLELDVDDTKLNKGLDEAHSKATKFGDDAEKSLDKAEKSSSKFGAAMGQIGTIAGGFLTANLIQGGFQKITSGIGDAMNAASDLNESMSKSQVVFGDSYDSIVQFATGAAKNLGMSKQSAFEAAGTFGNLFRAIGLGEAPAADLSKGIIGLGTDLASFNNLKPEDALEKLRAGLVGEAEPLRALGVNMNEAMVKAKGMELGLADSNGELSEGAKVQARYAIIMEQTKTAQGDFARTSEGAANQSRILAAQQADLSAKMGGYLLPIWIALQSFLITQFIPGIGQVVTGFAGVITSLSPLGAVLMTAFGFILDNWQPILAGILGVAAAIIGTMVPAAIAWTAAEIAKTVALIAAGAAFLLANAPLILIIASIGLLVAGIVLLVQHWDEIREKVPALGIAFDAVKAAIQTFVSWIGTDLIPAVQSIYDKSKPIIDLLVALFVTQFTVIQTTIETALGIIVTIVTTQFGIIKTVIETAIGVIKGIIDVFIGVFTGDWDRAWGGIKQIVDSIWNGAAGIVGLIKGATGEIMGIITGWLGDLYNAIVPKGLRDIFSGAEAWASDFVRLAGSTAADFISSLWSGFGDLYHLGADIINWVIQGLSSVAQSLYNKASEIAGNVASKLNPKNWFGSPKGIQNWFPYYFDIGMGNLVDAVASNTDLKAIPAVFTSTMGLNTDNFGPSGLTDLYQNDDRSGLGSNWLPQALGTRADAGGGGLSISMPNAKIYAYDKSDAERGTQDIGWAALQAVRSRGVLT